jgi:hypothetical protein
MKKMRASLRAPIGVVRNWNFVRSGYRLFVKYIDAGKRMGWLMAIQRDGGLLG